MEILYMDKHLVFISKPQGVPSQPNPSGQRDALTMLSEQFGMVYPVHRLDTPTGGVMVFARTPKAAAALSTMVQDHEAFVKEYLAVLSARPDFPEGVLCDRLYHDRRANRAFVVDGARKGTKEARLTYRILDEILDETLDETENGHTLIRIRLHTGRTHQIRVQFASRGFPLIGDGKYGSRIKSAHLALWSYSISCEHPITRKKLYIVSPPPKTEDLWNRFSWQASSNN